MQNKSDAGVYARARKTGVLKYTNRGITEIPDDIYNLLDKNKLSSTEKWWECVQLRQLDLSNNRLTSIDAAIGQHNELEVFLCRSNRLTNICVELFRISTLTKLSLFDNQLSELPEFEGNMPLVNMDVSKNRLNSLPESLSTLERLTILNASYNRLKTLPASLPPLLTSITITHCQLEELPRSIGSLRHLKTLDCGYNRLKSCPDMCGCVELTVISFESNQLTEAPTLPSSGTLSEINFSANGLRSVDGIEQCLSVAILLLHDNAIKELQPSIAKLPLKILDVSNNNLNDVPSELGRIRSLNKLIMNGNFLRKLKRSSVTMKIEDLKKYLRSRLNEGSDDEKEVGPIDIKLALRDASASNELNIADAQLEEVPPEAFSLALTKLNARGNDMVRLSRDFKRLAHSLRVLIVDNNKLASLCDEIGWLENLREFRARDNKLRMLPNMEQMKNLKSIDLRNNRFEEFPMNLIAVTSLERVLIGHNQLQQLPNINALVNLCELDVSSNQLVEIVDGLRYNEKLTVLNIENNSLKVLPLEIGVMNQLKTLMISGNSLRTIPYDKQRGSTDSLLKYLRGRIPEGSLLLGGIGANNDDVNNATVDTSVRDGLQRSIDELSRELDENLSLTKAKRYALKKDLAKHRAALIREERRLKNG